MGAAAKATPANITSAANLAAEVVEKILNGVEIIGNGEKSSISA